MHEAFMRLALEEAPFNPSRSMKTVTPVDGFIHLLDDAPDHRRTPNDSTPEEGRLPPTAAVPQFQA